MAIFNSKLLVYSRGYKLFIEDFPIDHFPMKTSHDNFQSFPKHCHWAIYLHPHFLIPWANPARTSPTAPELREDQAAITTWDGFRCLTNPKK